ncbi:MAG TPA: hypothetical protein VMW58_03210 [Anaerolineae bacterium]|nr:hypothetical protein [Anaerolineae bacterium]
MAMYRFVGGHPDFAGIISYSPLDIMICPEKPFGDVSAEDYLEFAREDLERGGPRGLVNALGNAKRCFHYQTDRLLYRYGLRNATAGCNFPQKVDVLRSLHMVSGALLRMFNSERNAMEHDYAAPTEDLVQGSADLCELFLLATERYLRRTPARIRFVREGKDRDLVAQLEPGADRIQLFQVHGTTAEDTEHGRIYTGNVLELFGEGRVAEGLWIEALPEEDLHLASESEGDWLPLLRLFSDAAQETGALPRYPEEEMLIIQHAVPWSEAMQAFSAAVDRKPE